MTCECRTRKIEYTCDKIRAENIVVIECDEQCHSKKLLHEEERRQELERMQQLEAEKNRQELLAYEKKFAKKVYKERKPKFVEEEKSNVNLMMLIISGSIVIAACGLYFSFFN